MGFNNFSLSVLSRGLLFVTLFALTNALPWAIPSPTFSYQPSDIAPRPTPLPRLPRDSIYPANVCGWVNGLGNSPILCPTDQSCVWDTVNLVVGCCPSTGCSSIVTGCVDSRATVHNDWNPNIMTCAGNAQCYQNVFPGGYTQHNCGSATWTATVQTTFADQPADIKLAISKTAMNPTSSATSAGSNSNTVVSSTLSSPTATASSPSSITTESSSIVSSSGSLTSGTSSLTTSSAGQASSPTTASSTSISSTPSILSPSQTDTITLVSVIGSRVNKTGVIIGGVLGGVVISLILGALCWWILRRRRQNRMQPLFDTNSKDYFGDGTDMSITTVDGNERSGRFGVGNHRTAVNQIHTDTEVVHHSQLLDATPPMEHQSYSYTQDAVVSPISSTRDAHDSSYALQSAVPSPLQLSSRIITPADLDFLKSESTLFPPPEIPRKSSKRARLNSPASAQLSTLDIPPLPTRKLSAASSQYSQESGTGHTARARGSSLSHESSKTNIKVPRPMRAPNSELPDTVTGFGLGVGVPRPSRAQLRDIDALAAMALRVPSPARLPSYKPRRVDGVPIVRVPVPWTREERRNSGSRVYVPNK